MIRPRVIPSLLLRKRGLVKGVNFRNYKYVGDPTNVVRIFSTKEVDELMFLDITATAENRNLSPQLIQDISDECFMPFGFGGGIRSMDTIKTVLKSGAEKVSINTAAVENPELIKEAADAFGSQAVVVSIDVRTRPDGTYEMYTHSGTKATGLDPVKFAVRMAELGAGEILLNSIDRDGTWEGYDTKLIQSVADAVDIPVIACGGAGKVEDLGTAIYEGGASAAAAGSLFVFQGSRMGVLTNFPTKEELNKLFGAD